MEENMNVCNDCEYFNVMTGWCYIRLFYTHPLTEACEEFDSWEECHD